MCYTTNINNVFINFSRAINCNHSWFSKINVIVKNLINIWNKKKIAQKIGGYIKV